jgi:hypothetical protein
MIASTSSNNSEYLRKEIERINKIVRPLADKESFANYYCQAASTQTPIQDHEIAMVQKALEQPTIRQMIAAEVRRTDRAWWNAAFKWALAGAGCLLLDRMINFAGSFIHLH